MPLHQQADAFLRFVAEVNPPPLESMPVPEARAFVEQGWAAPASGITDMEDVEIAGPRGPLRLRIHRPRGVAGPLPVLVFFHGGGWVLCSFDTHDYACEEIATKTPCIVVSVDYELSPESQFPGPVDECYAATVWASENAAKLGAKPGPVAIGGDSAGGHLAAAVALRARDNGLPLALQVLIYPVTDATFDNGSYLEFAEGFGLTRVAMIWFWEHFLGPDGDADHPEASPLRAKDVSGVAPAYVVTAEYDVLRDEGEAYAAKLKAAGVPTDFHRVDGLLHGFVTQKDLFDGTAIEHDSIAAALRKAFA